MGDEMLIEGIDCCCDLMEEHIEAGIFVLIYEKMNHEGDVPIAAQETREIFNGCPFCLKTTAQLKRRAKIMGGRQ